VHVVSVARDATVTHMGGRGKMAWARVEYDGGGEAVHRPENLLVIGQAEPSLFEDELV
jgi:hypothetical protein